LTPQDFYTNVSSVSSNAEVFLGLEFRVLLLNSLEERFHSEIELRELIVDEHERIEVSVSEFVSLDLREQEHVVIEKGK
jgi:hypothetical protein